MRFEIKFSQRAISSFDALPKDVVKKVQRVLSFLEEAFRRLGGVAGLAHSAWLATIGLLGDQTAGLFQ